MKCENAERQRELDEIFGEEKMEKRDLCFECVYQPYICDMVKLEKRLEELNLMRKEKEEPTDKGVKKREVECDMKERREGPKYPPESPPHPPPPPSTSQESQLPSNPNKSQITEPDDNSLNIESA